MFIIFYFFTLCIFLTSFSNQVSLNSLKFNITNDIVKGLNKRYKIKPEVAEQIKANKE